MASYVLMILVCFRYNSYFIRNLYKSIFSSFNVYFCSPAVCAVHSYVTTKIFNDKAAKKSRRMYFYYIIPIYQNFYACALHTVKSRDLF